MIPNYPQLDAIVGPRPTKLALVQYGRVQFTQLRVLVLQGEVMDAFVLADQEAEGLCAGLNATLAYRPSCFFTTVDVSSTILH